MGAAKVADIVHRRESQFVPATDEEGFDDVLHCETEAKVAAALRTVVAEGNVIAGEVATLHTTIACTTAGVAGVAGASPDIK